MTEFMDRKEHKDEGTDTDKKKQDSWVEGVQETGGETQEAFLENENSSDARRSLCQMYWRFILPISKHLIILNCPDNAEIPLRAQGSIQIDKTGIKIGISEISDSRKETATIFKQADKAALDDFITGKSEVVYFSEPDTAFIKENVDSIIDIIKKGNTELLDNAFAGVQHAFRQKSPGMSGVEMFYNYIILYLMNNYDKGKKWIWV